MAQLHCSGVCGFADAGPGTGVDVGPAAAVELGSCARIECLTGLPTWDPRSRQYSRPWIVEMTMCMSDHRVRIAVWSLHSEHGWCRLIERALRFFGGVPRSVVYSQSVMRHVKPGVRDPERNVMLASTIAHYGFLLGQHTCAAPFHPGDALPGDADDVGCSKGISFLRSPSVSVLRFESLDHQNAYWMRRSTHWVASSIGNRSRSEVFRMFERERRCLMPIPAVGVQYFKEVLRVVCDDGCIRLHNSSYMAFPAAIGSRVRVRVFSQKLEIYAGSDHVDHQGKAGSYVLGASATAKLMSMSSAAAKSIKKAAQSAAAIAAYHAIDGEGVNGSSVWDTRSQNTPIRTYWRQDAIRGSRSEVFARSDERFWSHCLQTEQILYLASSIGPHIRRWCDRVFLEQGRLAHRTMWAVVSLSSRIDPECVDSACAAGLAQSVLTYQHVKTLAQQIHRSQSKLSQHSSQLKLDLSD